MQHDRAEHEAEQDATAGALAAVAQLPWLSPAIEIADSLPLGYTINRERLNEVGEMVRPIALKHRDRKPLTSSEQAVVTVLEPFSNVLGQFADIETGHREADRDMRNARKSGIAVIDNGQYLPPIQPTHSNGTSREHRSRRSRKTASSSSASGDEPPDEPEPPSKRRLSHRASRTLTLAPSPRARYTFACLSSEQRS